RRDGDVKTAGGRPAEFVSTAAELVANAEAEAAEPPGEVRRAGASISTKTSEHHAVMERRRGSGGSGADVG
ncbi:hypothetical protein OC835_007994, partial [Tilletia horrida]